MSVAPRKERAGQVNPAWKRATMANGRARFRRRSGWAIPARDAGTSAML
ncbi:hypothetical protein DFR74_1072 [Nocardia puris]|uniref:Uncharacterized protein n=1 Tax=Nocardia puris TaxID=208602 RepID=A0A366DHA4_9NOCA|nr:hypothetical protein DFR74_1072 [Nocardia puris]